MSDNVFEVINVLLSAIPTVHLIPESYLRNRDHTNRVLITDVWDSNLEDEFHKIRSLIDRYPYVAMDTEFPGVVVRIRPQDPKYYAYENLRANVNMLKIIQLGITLSDSQGRLPEEGTSTWQFNFRFSLDVDPYAEDSIDLLRSSGIDFDQFKNRGIYPERFAELMLMSGLCLNDRVRWLSFHSSFDFGYLVRMLTGRELPEREADFLLLLRKLFGAVFDTKYLLKHVQSLTSNVGLNGLADELGVARIGPAHQAGSDSLLTWATYFKLVADHFGRGIAVDVVNVLYGLGTDATYASAAMMGPTGVTSVAVNVPGRPTSPAPMLGEVLDIAASVQEQLAREQRALLLAGTPVAPPPAPPPPPLAVAVMAAGVEPERPRGRGNGGDRRRRHGRP